MGVASVVIPLWATFVFWVFYCTYRIALVLQKISLLFIETLFALMWQALKAVNILTICVGVSVIAEADYLLLFSLHFMGKLIIIEIFDYTQLISYKYFLPLYICV